MLFESSDIYKAIMANSLETPSKTLTLIKSGKQDINIKSTNDQTYLHLIASLFQKDEDAPCLIPVVFQLSNAGIERNSRDSDGNTALHAAAKSNGTRRILRAFLMIGVDPKIKNNEKQTAADLAKSNPENLKILKMLSPGLWQAVHKTDKDKVAHLLENWCKVNESRDGVTLLEVANQYKNDEIAKQLQLRENTITFAHFALAGDRSGMRPLFKTRDYNINTVSTSYVDLTSGEFIAMPLLGETALLGLTAVVRKLIRKKVDINVDIGNTRLYIYIMQNILPQKEFYAMVEYVLDKIDFKKKRDDTAVVLDAAYDKKLPIRVLRTMAINGLDLFATDENGYFLRDRILIKNIDESPKQLEKELTYVDNIVVDLAINGCIDMLQGLVEKNYDHLDVSNVDGLTARDGLAKSKGDVQAQRFFKDIIASQKMHRDIIRVIDIGHLAQIQKMLNVNVAKIKDRHGRTLVHRAVLFERRHVLRHLIKVCPNSLAAMADKDGRTPLHWACALEDGDDMAAALKALGCKMETKDKNGQTPSDFKAMHIRPRQALLAKERATDYGIDAYLYYKYLDIKEAIRAGDLPRVEEIRGGMYRDIPTKDITSRMYQTTTPQKCLLQFAMDARRDAIAKYLLTMGMDWDVKYKDGDESISLLEAARRKEMSAVESYINIQLKNIEDQKVQIEKLRRKGVVKNVK